jgi:hypothetical protein
MSGGLTNLASGTTGFWVGLLGAVDTGLSIPSCRRSLVKNSKGKWKNRVTHWSVQQDLGVTQELAEQVVDGTFNSITVFGDFAQSVGPVDTDLQFDDYFNALFLDHGSFTVGEGLPQVSPNNFLKLFRNMKHKAERRQNLSCGYSSGWLYLCRSDNQLIKKVCKTAAKNTNRYLEVNGKR